MQKIFALLIVLSVNASPALANEFNLNVDGRIYTCAEGGIQGCSCKKVPGSTTEMAVFVGEIQVSANMPANERGVRSCKSWIRANPSTCN